MRLVYPIDLQAVDDGLAVIFPDLPEAITWGADRAEALANATDSLEEALASRIKRRDDIPRPSPARGRSTAAPGSLIAAKTALYVALREDKLRPADLARAMGVNRQDITRLLDPRHATKAAQLDAAFAALGRRAVLSVERAA